MNVETRYRQEYVAAQAAVAGMVLAMPANAVAGGARVFSLPSGHVLTQDNLYQLARHRVEFIVVDVPDQRTHEQVAKERGNTSERMRRIFRGANLNDHCTAALFEQVLAFRSA